MIVIPRDALADALSTLAALVTPTDILPILRHVVIEPRDGEARIEANNLDQSASVVLQCQSDEAEMVAVEGRRLQSIVGTLPRDGEVRIEAKDGFAMIACGRSRLKLPTLPGSDYPRAPFEAGGPSFTAPASDLGRAIARTAYAHGNEVHRAYLCGARVEEIGGKIVIVATNGKNLARVETDIPGPGWNAVIWPTRFTEMLEKRLVGDDTAKVELDQDKARVRVTFGGWALSSKLIQLNYPDWQRAIPSEDGISATVDCKQAHAAVSRTLLATDLKGVKAVKLDLGPDGITVTHGDNSGREGVDEIPADVSGEGYSAFDSQHLLAVLANAGETATFVFRGVDQATTITNPADPSFLALLYPYRI